MALLPRACLGVLLGAALLGTRPVAAQPSPDIRSYVAVADTQLVLRGAGVVRRGNVAVTAPGGFMMLGKHTNLPTDSEATADMARLIRGTTVGRLFTNTFIDGGATITGGGPLSVSLPLALTGSLPPFPTATPGPTAIEVLEGTTLVLAPGAYDLVRVRTGGTLILQGLSNGGAGVYELRVLSLSFDSNLLADNPVVLNVADRLAVSGQSFLGPSGRAAALAGDVEINVGGRARLAQATTVAAHVRTPGKIIVGAGATITGRLIAARISASHDVTLTNQGGCGDGVLDAGEQCDTSAGAGGDVACPGRCIPGDPQGLGRITSGQPGQCTCRCTSDADCDDHDVCNGVETCQAGVCVFGAAPACDDGNPCTTDCDPVRGCVHTPLPDGTSCSDHNVCTRNDICQSGTCMAGAPRDCDDQNPCTADTCDPLSGCTHRTLPDGALCSDANACTAPDICRQGGCIPGAAVSCADTNPCTQDTCDPVQGCVHRPVLDGTHCSDGNACTTLDACVGGACVGGPPPGCDDANPCTTDLCDSVRGCLHPPVTDGTSCADGRTCRAGVCG
jgi:hypothetical protein